MRGVRQSVKKSVTNVSLMENIHLAIVEDDALGQEKPKKPKEKHKHPKLILEPEETIDFDYCLICAGGNFGPFHKLGAQLPQVVHLRAALASPGGVSPCGSPPSMKMHGQKAYPGRVGSEQPEEVWRQKL